MTDRSMLGRVFTIVERTKMLFSQSLFPPIFSSHFFAFHANSFVASIARPLSLEMSKQARDSETISR
jgi:hypothetical protein